MESKTIEQGPKLLDQWTELILRVFVGKRGSNSVQVLSMGGRIVLTVTVWLSVVNKACKKYLRNYDNS